MMGKDPGSVPMDDPLAFFLTWTTYGSWLPGDERGWVDKPGRFREPDAKREEAARRRMTEPELTLDAEQRDVVEKTIADHCRTRRWHLHAVKCRTQHVHVVVTAPNRDPDDVMDQLKAWCTRHLKEHSTSKPEAQAKDGMTPEGQAEVREKWWTQRGSKRRLYDQTSLEAAIRYVLEGQGDPPTDLT